jgi:ATP-dependent exoDNAse (exonuclease V) alpha subunit
MEQAISDRVRDGKSSAKHALSRKDLDKQFDQLESELSGKLGVAVSLSQQREAALHIGCESGNHAFIEGWAGTGKTTMLKAVAKAYKGSGFKTVGCCQSAAAAQNLSRETGIPSKTIASLLISISSGRIKLGAQSILFLDEAGMVGSREFGLLQKAVVEAGAKLVCVGDPKQLQPIEAGGIFASLMRAHGKAEISNIQRQRTDFEPLIEWLKPRLEQAMAPLSPDQEAMLRTLPEDAREKALTDIAKSVPNLEAAFKRWKERFDHEWLREVVQGFAKGQALESLKTMDSRGRLKLLKNQESALAELMQAWKADKTPIERKAIIASTRAEVAELNDAARKLLIDIGRIKDSQGIDIDIIHRDETISPRRFAPGDRIVFTMNDRELGVVNGATATITDIAKGLQGPALLVRLDDPNDIGQREVAIPASFGRFDHAWARTNHKLQGQTFDSAHVLVNPSMADREWSYVATSRSRFATTIYVDASKLGLVDPDSHRQDDQTPKGRSRAIEALAIRMKRSGAKGTSLDYSESEPVRLPEAKGKGKGDIAYAKTGIIGRVVSALAQRREARR